MRKSGVKFGLIGTASSLKKGGAAGRPIGSKPAPRPRPPGATSVFDANSDEEEGTKGDISGVAAVNKRLAAISAKQEKQAKKEYQDALEADPSVFDYDQVYDGMKDSRESKAAAAKVAHEKEKRQPKYIGNLLKQAKMRAVESDRIFERKLQKEREEQDKLEGEATMKFVTSAYKKKLMEQKKWELQEKLEDEREQRNDVTKTGMSGFYSNLITKNIAMGGDVEKSANSAFTAGSKRHAATAEYEMNDGNAEAADDRRKRNVDDDDDGSRAENAGADNRGGRESRGRDDSDDQEADAGPTAKMVDPRAATSDRSSVRREGGDRRVAGERAGGRDAAERELKSRAEGGVVGGTADGQRQRHGDAGATLAKRPRLSGEGEARVGDTAGGAVGGRVDRHSQREETVGETSAGGDKEKAERVAAAKAKKEAAIKAARERFLARKKTA